MNGLITGLQKNVGFKPSYSAPVVNEEEAECSFTETGLETDYVIGLSAYETLLMKPARFTSAAVLTRIALMRFRAE